MKPQQKTTFVQKRVVKIGKAEKVFNAGEKMKAKLVRDKEAQAKASA